MSGFGADLSQSYCSKRARMVDGDERSIATPYTNAKTDSEETSGTTFAPPKGVSPQDLSYISSSSEESVVDISLVMEGVVASSLPSADAAAAVPSHSSDVDEDRKYKEVSSIEEARVWLEKCHPKSSLAVLAKQYSLKAYGRLLGRGEGKAGKRCHHRLVNGQVQLFELPSKIHEVSASQIFAQLRDQHQHVDGNGSGDIYINATTKLEPDGSLFIDAGTGVPRPGALDPKGGRLPKIVVEVSYSEPYDSIGALPEMYFSVGGEDGIQAVILIIIRHADQPVEGRCQLVAILYDYRTNRDAHNPPVPSIAISFGDYLHCHTKDAIRRHCRVPDNLWTGVVDMQPTLVCDQEGLAAFQLQIDDGDLLWRGYDAAARARLAANDTPFVVDLFELKRRIKDEIIHAVASV